jgi:hypothetical protein
MKSRVLQGRTFQNGAYDRLIGDIRGHKM